MVSEEELRRVGLIGPRMGGESEPAAIALAGVIYEQWVEIMRTYRFTYEKDSIPVGAKVRKIPETLEGWLGQGWYYKEGD